MFRELLALACVASTAGCLGVFGPTETPTPVTPMPVIEQPAPGVPSPGQSAVGVDTDQLLAADDRVRSNTAHRVEQTVTVRGPNSSLSVTQTKRVGPDGAILERLSADGTGRLSPAIESGRLWVEESTRWSRIRLPDGRTFLDRPPSLAESPFLTGRSVPEQVLRDAEFDVATSSEEVVLRSTERRSLDSPVLPRATSEPRNASTRVVLDPDGLVTRITVSYETSVGEDPVRVTVEYRTVRTTTSVSRPEWVPTEATTGRQRTAVPETERGA